MILLDHVSLTATAGTVLNDISLVIEPGECIAIVGSSGSGKSLLLSLLTGERRPTSGRVTIDSIDLAQLTSPLLRVYRQNLGILLQEPQLLPELSIAANIALPLTIQKKDSETIARRVTRLLEEINLLSSAADLPETLSRSKKRLIALAQAICHEPMIFIADEPCADLDLESRAIALSLLKEAVNRGATLILATNVPSSIEELSPRIVRLERGSLINHQIAGIRASESASHATITPTAL